MNRTLRGLIVLIVMVVFIGLSCVWLPFVFLPGQHIGVGLPVIFVPGEVLVENWLGEGFHLTNTLVGMFLTDAVLLILLALLYLRGGVRAVPGRLQSLFELFVEFMYNLAKSVAGSRVGRLFPLVMTIFVFLLVGNWLELVPGVDSVGLLHCAEPGFAGYPINAEGNPIEGAVTLRVDAPLDAGTRATLADFCACEAENVGHIPEEYAEECADLGFAVEHDEGEHQEDAADSAETQAPAGGEGEMAAAEANPDIFVVTPFVRAAATDLNLTIGLAIIAVIAIQVYGAWALGPGYFMKFVNLNALGNLGKKPMGLIDFGVGLIEIVSELAKIISFAFRLFGNIFAGQVLLFIMAFLVATVLPVVFYALELFVGLMQAFVFAVLTLIFSAQAMEGHHGDDHDEHH